jgi:hypothetical protein
MLQVKPVVQVIMTLSELYCFWLFHATSQERLHAKELGALDK